MTQRTRHRGAETYPVKRGQVWKVDRHHLACSDTVEDRVIEDLVAEHRPDITYADPVWSNGQAQQFRTLSALPPAGYDFSVIYARIFAVTHGIPQWIVTDRRPDARKVTDMMLGGYRAHWDLDGFSTPSVRARLHYWGPAPPPEPNEHLAHRKDKALPVAILALHDYQGTVLDPCGGLGLTVLAAIRNGWTAITNELSPYRVSAALTRLSAATSSEPVRIH